MPAYGSGTQIQSGKSEIGNGTGHGAVERYCCAYGCHFHSREALIKSARVGGKVFSSGKGVERGGILYVFSLFQSAFPAEKTRCPALVDLIRASLESPYGSPAVIFLICGIRFMQVEPPHRCVHDSK